MSTAPHALRSVQDAHLAVSCQASTFSWTLSIRFVFRFVQMELLKISKTSNATPVMTAAWNAKARQAIVHNAQQRTRKNTTNSRQWINAYKIHVQFSSLNRGLTHVSSARMENSETGWEEQPTNVRQRARMDVRLVLTRVWPNALHARTVSPM
jgi:hypothetical protein